MRDRRGVTLVEVLVTVTVVAVLSGILLPRAAAFVGRYQLDAAKAELVAALRLAQSRSVAGEQDGAWGVHLVSGGAGSFTLFKGASFAGRDAAFDQPYDLPASLVLAETVAGDDVTFIRSEGSSPTPGTITLSWPDGGRDAGADVTAQGMVDPF